MKILIVRIGALGDALHSLPLVNEIKRLMPDAQIHWAAGGGVQKFLQGHRSIDAFVPVSKGAGGLLRAIRNVRSSYDCAIDAQGLMKSALIARSASRRVIGRARGYARETPATFFYSESVVPSGSHIIDQNLSLIRSLVSGNQAHEINYHLPVPAAPDWDLLEERPIIVNMGGGWWTKLWPLEKFAALVREIDKRLGVPVGVVWGPGEEEAARHLTRISPAVMGPRTSFGELGAVFKKSRLLISGETGPLHLAVAVECPVVALLGPTSDARNGPYPSSRHVSVVTDVSCSPCYARSCADFRCMPSLPVASVFDAVSRILV